MPSHLKWIFEQITVIGDALDEAGRPYTEDVGLWMQNPVHCVAELIGNPMFHGSISYVPEHVYADSEGKIRIYDEMWTGDWWWEIQSKIMAGGVVSPIILASDKTTLSNFGGDKQAYPVYLTIGNICKSVRRQTSSYATVLLAYLPVAKLDCFTESKRPLGKYQLFHACMKKLLEPLKGAGVSGVKMTCADSHVRHVFPILAAYIADHPEQCLVVCCQENRCPICTVSATDRGKNTPYPLRKQSVTEAVLHKQQNGDGPREFVDWGLREVFSPFWAGMPHCDIFQCISPDILHQLHKGVFKDHLLKWCEEIIGTKTMDNHFRAMADFPGLQHFGQGISRVSQWTGTMAKQAERVFIPVIAGAVNHRVLAAAIGLLDFIQYAQYQSHTSDTLAKMQQALNEFHDHKDVFIELDIHKHFNFPKLHALLHYVSTITRLGSADGYNSESPERFHIDYAKLGYKATNRHDYIAQMTLWLQCREAMAVHKAFLIWLGLLPSTFNDEDWQDDDAGTESDSETNTPKYTIAKNAPFHTTSVRTLAFSYGAHDFVSALNIFLQKTFPNSYARSNSHDQFDVYKCATVHQSPQPHTGGSKGEYRIRAVPSHSTISTHGLYKFRVASLAPQPSHHLRQLHHSPAISAHSKNRVRKGQKKAHFDTVLIVNESHWHQQEIGLKGMSTS